MADVTVTWDPPATSGSGPVTDYRGTVRLVSNNGIVLGPTAGITSPHTFTGLTVGVAVYVEVEAFNVTGGWGPAGVSNQVTPGESYLDAILTVGTPQGVWLFDEASGNFADSSGNSRTLTAVGGPVYGLRSPVGGGGGKAVKFRRGTGESCYAQAPSSTAWGGKTFTIIQPVRATSMNQGQVLWGGQGADGLRWALEPNAGADMDMALWSSGGIVARSVVAISDIDRYHFLVVRANGNMNTTKFGVDGNWNLGVDAPAVDRTVQATAQTVRIGQTWSGYGGEASHGGFAASGAVFYQQYLSDADLDRLYAAARMADGHIAGRQSIKVGAHADLVYMGTSYHDPIVHASSDAHLRMLRHSWVPTNVWGDASPSGPDWTRINSVLQRHAQYGIGVMWNFVGTPAYMNGGAAGNLIRVPVDGSGVITAAFRAAYKQMVRDFVAYVNPVDGIYWANNPTLTPVPTVYECWNETNLDGFWDESDGGVPNPANVLLLSNDTIDGVLLEHPGAEVAFGCVSGDSVGGGSTSGSAMLDGLLSPGTLDARFSIVSIHNYPVSILPGTHADFNNSWGRMIGMVADIAAYRGRAISKVWVTEMAYDRNTFSAANQAVHGGAWADYIRAQAGIYPIDQLYWFLTDARGTGETDPFGLYSNGAGVYVNYAPFAIRNTWRDKADVLITA